MAVVRSKIIPSFIPPSTLPGRLWWFNKRRGSGHRSNSDEFFLRDFVFDGAMIGDKIIIVVYIICFLHCPNLFSANLYSISNRFLSVSSIPLMRFKLLLPNNCKRGRWLIVGSSFLFCKMMEKVKFCFTGKELHVVVHSGAVLHLCCPLTFCFQRVGVEPIQLGLSVTLIKAVFLAVRFSDTIMQYCERS